MIEGDINCTLCTLHKTCEYVCLMGKGPIPCDIMVVGEAPGFREDTTGQPFQGKAGKILDGLLEECGINRKNLYLANAVKCHCPQNSTPKKKEIAACSKYLMEEIAQVKPKFILLLGNTAAISVLGSSYPRLKMGEIRGRFFEVEETNIFATYHPSVAVRGISKYTNVMKSDIKRFFQVALTGEVPREEGSNLKIINSTEEFDDFMDRLEKEKLVSFDIETTELNPRLGKVVSLGFGLEKEQDVIPLNHRNGWLRGQFDAQKEFCEIIEEVLEGRTLIAHNGKFDSGWMSVQYGVDYSIDHDTMLMSHLIDENSQHGLKFLAEKYFAAQNYDISLEAKTGHVSLETLATYNGLDVYYTRKLFTDVFYPELEKDPALLKFYEIVVMPASRYFRDIEEHGVYINMSKLEEVEQHLNDQVTQLQNELDKLKPGVNWNSTKQVAEFLFKDLRLTPLDKTASGAYSTSESVMQRLARKHPAPQKILDLRAANKMLSTFITSWKESAIDSRLHPSFKLHGTNTGRLCLAKDTLITTPKGCIPIQDIKPGDLVYSYDNNQKLTLAKVKWAGFTGNKECYRVNWSAGGKTGYLIATGNHPIRIDTGEYVPVEKLKRGQSVMALQRREDGRQGYVDLRIFGDSKERRHEHRVVYQILTGRIPNEIHHIDGNRKNNIPSNLGETTKSEHIKTHQTTKEASRRAKLGHLRNGEYMVKRTIEARKKWSQEFLSQNQAIEAYKKFEGQKHQAEKAAESLGVTRKTLTARLADAGIGSYQGRKSTSNGRGYIEDKEVIEAWNTLKSINRAAELLEVSSNTVRRCLDRNGINWKVYNIQTPNKKTIIKTYEGLIKESDKPIKETAKKLNISERVVRRRLRECDIKTNNHKISSVIKLGGLYETFDIELEEHHNFIANETCVHNSCSSPNIQQIPRDPKIRSLVTAPPGWTLVECDFSQVELRIAAILSGDKEMQRAFREGEDIHTKTARAVTGQEPPTDKHELKEWRKKAKACFTGDTEILTKKGWIRFDQYDGIEPVAQYDQDTREIDFVEPLAFKRFRRGGLLHFEDRNNDIRVTPEHLMLYKSRKGLISAVEAQNLASSGYFINAGYYKHDNKLNEIDTRILALIVADSHFKDPGIFRFGFKKERKCIRFKQLMDRAGIIYKEYHKGDVTKFVINNYELYKKVIRYCSPEKELSWSCLDEISGLWYLHEASYWDSHLDTRFDKDRAEFSTVVKQTAEVMQALGALCGIRVIMYEKTPVDKKGVSYKLSYRPGGKEDSRVNVDFKPIEGVFWTYCVQVPKGNILVRRNGKITVTKNCNFGFLYGMGYKTFQNYARDNYGVSVTEPEAKKTREKFFKTYAQLQSWYDRQHRVAKLNGYVRYLDGRIRHLPDIHSGDDFLISQAERNSVNAPVQGFASDMTLMAVIEIMNTFSEDTLNIVGTVHDAILCEIKTEKVSEVVPQVKAIMGNPQILAELGIKLPIPIIADEAIGPWGNGIPLEEWNDKTWKSEPSD